MGWSAVGLAVTLPVLVIALGSFRRLVQSRQERKGLPFPPGPAQVPLLGSAHAIDLREPWKTYAGWHAQYGSVLYLRLLNHEVIVLGSQPVAVELLEKRSRLYSDRPHIAMLKPFGADCNFAFIQYEAVRNFRPMQIRLSRKLVANILSDPDQYMSHYTTFSAAIALLVSYGYEPSSGYDPMVQAREDYLATVVPATTSEQAILLKLLPFLMDIPDWFPGSSLKLTAKRAYELSVKMVDMPYQYAEEKVTSFDGDVTSMVSHHLARMQKGITDGSQRAEYVSALKDASTTSVMGSAETITSSLMIFTLAMVLHPHVWKRAQAEIDATVGTSRLPEFDDRPSLPYVEAIIRETIRWRPVLPLGVWHATMDSDVYNGYYIPKGAVVVANAWAMSRDEVRFPNAEAFTPERFLNGDGTLNDNDPMDFAFGFGRRICPGRYTAEASLWSSITTLLATFEFCPSRDAQGNELGIEPKWTNGISYRPGTFPCDITPRAHVNKHYLESMLAN